MECSNGTNVRSAKQGYEITVEVEKDRGLLGNFLRERNQSQIKDHLVQENILKIEKFFRREKTPLRLGTNFWDVTGAHDFIEVITSIFIF